MTPGALRRAACVLFAASQLLGASIAHATSPLWIVDGDQARANFAVSVAAAGDVNGDGYADVIIGARQYGPSQTGRAFLYLGSAAGLDTAWAWSAGGEQSGSSFGTSVASAGDINGDGFADVIVGAPRYSGGGRAYVFLGSASGLSPSSAWFGACGVASAQFGVSVATAGDVNHDGYSDVIVGAYRYDGGANLLSEGQAFVYLGSAQGLGSTAAWSAAGSGHANALFGYSVGGAGDVDHDGHADIIIGAPDDSNGESLEGRAFVYFGSDSGISARAPWITEGNQADASFGLSVAGAGDVNADGYADVIIGADHFNDGEYREGWAYVFHGSASGLAATPAWHAESDQAGAIFGLSVAGAGDVNRDGYSDVIIGAPKWSDGSIKSGRAWVYLGAASGLGAMPAWTAHSDQDSSYFGFSVGSAGNVNGDAYSDVIVGAKFYISHGSERGRAYVYLGSALGPGLVAVSRPETPAPELRVALASANPSRSHVHIRYALPRAGRAELSVYDARGGRVAVLVDAFEAAGEHEITWDGRSRRGKDTGAGIFWTQLRCGARSVTRKIVRE